ncbi:MAG: ribonuclease J [Candidatus Obscuribacter sp.]|nr:ribonuclease J [Candidatus Obscuribacter sp.]MBK9617866.1 ribonuclease J [Candidatus Obscuribacter sp.]
MREVDNNQKQNSSADEVVASGPVVKMLLPLAGDVLPNTKTLKVIPLGGLDEIGKNTMVIAYGDDMFLVDAGMAFPTEDMLGVDVVLPELEFLKVNQSKIRGIAITHGHEDHIGGIPFMLQEITVPVIYGPSLALGLLSGKLAENGLEGRTELRQVSPRQKVRMGVFEVEFIRCTHSIADSYSLIIRTPVGTVVHTGDFKFDFTPVDGEQFDIAHLTKAADEGILLLLSDSTNAERPGYTPSERTVWNKLNEVFTQAKARIIVTTFASNVNRVKQVLQLAIDHHRKVAVLGRSMLTFARIARELGYMSFPDDLIVPIDSIRQMPLDEIVILTTGSQGEPMSALTRIANDDHRMVKIIAGDTVVVSATPIPGNERSVANTINALFTRGAKVVYGRDAGVHVSGHACREEQKLMINLCKPKLFMPVHGEYRMLVKHAEIAQDCGVEADNTFVLQNGDVLEVSKDKGEKTCRVSAGVVLIDFNRDWKIDEEIVVDRRKLADDGLIAVVVTISDKGEIVAGPDVALRGIILPRGVPAEEFVLTLREQTQRILSKSPVDLRNTADGAKQVIFDGLTEFLETVLHINPLLQVVTMRSNAPQKLNQDSILFKQNKK